MNAQSPHSARRKVGLVSLGCAKNLVDAEIMIGSLLDQGIEIVNDPATADAIIVNTCSFIDSAQEESVDAILEATAARDARNPGQAVIVAGCLPQRFRKELPSLLPEVDAIMGIDQVADVGRIVDDAIGRRATRPVAPKAPGRRSRDVRRSLEHLTGDAPGSTHHAGHDHHETPPSRHGTPATPQPTAPAEVLVHLRPSYIPHHDTPRFRLTPRHFAYVKIAEGCNHPCTFCIIPRMRGPHRSRGPADIVSEARRLLDEGVRELNLISQDSTYYGLDLRSNPNRAIASPERFQEASQQARADGATLGTLLRQLNALPGEFWIRLLYTHPAHWTDDLIRTIADCPKVARYIDMPLQHIHDDILRRMRRETSGAYIRDLIDRIRLGIPGIALRTTFIVGFPGETQAHFETLLEFVRSTRFERLGVFAYSREEGTVAGRMEKQVPGKTRQRRRDLIMETQLAIARELGAAKVGSTLRVLLEKATQGPSSPEAPSLSWEHGLIRAEGNSRTPARRGPWTSARSQADAPDIDGRVFVRGRLETGGFADVRVIGHGDYDLMAEPA